MMKLLERKWAYEFGLKADKVCEDAGSTVRRKLAILSKAVVVKDQIQKLNIFRASFCFYDLK